MFSAIEHQGTGGQVLKLGDILYLNPHTRNPDTSKRGVIPVLFPQFANAGRLQKHGFARNRSWQLRQIEQPSSDTQTQQIIEYQLPISSNDDPDWPHDARLTLRCKYQVNDVLIEFLVTNCGNTTFSWRGGTSPPLFS